MLTRDRTRSSCVLLIVTRGFALIALLLVLAAGAEAQPGATPSAGRVEVVVTLASPPLARAPGSRPEAAVRIEREQRAFARLLLRAVPSASVRWRYRLVANGLAVVVPHLAVDRLRALPGVRDVFAATRYVPSTARGPLQQIGAPTLWAPGLANAGNGVKIGIIDDGVDQRHPYFDPSDYAMPPGFPKGQWAYTTAKVIVARAFPPPRATWKYASRPFDPLHSSHGTHVAGIAAGNANTVATTEGQPTLSGVAPRAYIGNYKVLTVPTDANVGLDGNSPELVAAIEAAVADGMDVINLSIGEPEIEPSRDIVAKALDAAADAGVVPVVAAGNDFPEFGRGSLASPGNAAKAITVGAVTTDDSGPGGVLGTFSSAGPTPISLRLKPDVSAPGVGILSSIPSSWGTLSGTSMATPHVSGASALLLQRHADWTPGQVKAALVGTADPAYSSSARTAEAVPSRAGSGVVNLVRADRPLVLAQPSSLSFGLLNRGRSQVQSVDLEDAGGGAGTWEVSVETRSAPGGALLVAPPTVTVPGPLALTASADVSAGEGELAGIVVLTKDGERRRIPFWLRVTNPALAAAPVTRLSAPGTYRGDTRGRPSLVSVYRYPEVPADGLVSSELAGPEQVFRLTLSRPVANFGVVVTRRASGVQVEPRVVVAGDENRLVGYPGLPLTINPYLAGYLEPVPAAGAIRPLAGAYDLVFDSPTAAGAGPFTFRLWLNDQTPPLATLLTTNVRRGAPLLVRISDTASGIDPASLVARMDGRERPVLLRGGVARISTAGLAPGKHRLRFQVSDYQESRNMENVPAILPNTRVLSATVVVRRQRHA